MRIPAVAGSAKVRGLPLQRYSASAQRRTTRRGADGFRRCVSTARGLGHRGATSSRSRGGARPTGDEQLPTAPTHFEEEQMRQIFEVFDTQRKPVSSERKGSLSVDPGADPHAVHGDVRHAMCIPDASDYGGDCLAASPTYDKLEIFLAMSASARDKETKISASRRCTSRRRVPSPSGARAEEQQGWRTMVGPTELRL